MNDFVESMVPLKAIKSAVDVQHSHENMNLLNSLISNGSATVYLGGDGQYHEVPPLFDIDAFLDNYDQTGNVKATKSSEGQLTLNASFGSAGSGLVNGITFTDDGSNTIGAAISTIDLSTGQVGKLPFVGFAGLGAVNLALSESKGNQTLQISLNGQSEPFLSKMDLVVPSARLNVGVLDTDGQIIDSNVNISSLATNASLTAHTSNSTIHTNENEKAAWNAKQDALSGAQLNAVNSGITASLVSQYSGYNTSKLSIAGHTPNQNVVTDSSGSIAYEAKPDLSVKMNTVTSAVSGHVANFGSGGQVVDSGVVLGTFSGQTVRQYIDTSIASTVSGSSYQGTVTYFGSKQMVNEAVGPKTGDTALAYEGELTAITSLYNGTYGGSSWSWTSVMTLPSNGAWWECDYNLTSTPHVAGRIIMRQDGSSAPSLDVRSSSSTPVDNVTIALDSQGMISFKTKTLSSGKSVLNSTTADNIAYSFTNSGGADTSKTIKEVIDANAAAAEPAFAKNTAFNKNFDTSSQSASSTMVIGNNDTRLTNARPASDVYAWAKAASLAVSSVPNLPASKITSGTFNADRIEDGSITAAKLADSYATAAQGTLATNAVRSVTAATSSTNGNTAITVNTGGTSTTLQLKVTGLASLAYLSRVSVSLIDGLGAAATYGVDTSVTAGSSDLITSGAVSTALGNLSASSIKSGTLSMARGGTGVSWSASSTAGAVYHASSGSTLSIGTLPVSMGGTGASTFASGQLLIGNGTGAVSTRAITTTIANNTNIPTAGAVLSAINGLALANVGSSNSASKLFLVGATSQSSSTKGYSNSAVYTQSGYLYANRVYNAVFNDYAEYRLCREPISAGYIVAEDPNDCDHVILCNGAMRSKMFVVSDTFGTCMGSAENSVPVALCGRVLLYIKDRELLRVGDYVGCSTDGRGRKMSRLEAWLHPSRVIGTVSSIPDYRVWGTNSVNVDGRVWVNLK